MTHARPPAVRRFLTRRQRALTAAGIVCSVLFAGFGAVAYLVGKDGFVPRSEAAAQTAGIIRK